ncbi:hypothetical protein MF271_00970 (plasmid) [Deinococcus sp. KNUC1210]|uniref:hypothetical protein n=1 Tax=Deinococcus sp. KNUC1210 TaxID=2917691 RepID=UPI001EF021FB|nr:hypothetical protein [Deinococcus sp. KNUC1210]ULH13934.1 hypothetical protein MF271_00970 [Deinococcus sp. KNUC1210]
MVVASDMRILLVVVKAPAGRWSVWAVDGRDHAGRPEGRPLSRLDPVRPEDLTGEEHPAFEQLNAWRSSNSFIPVPRVTRCTVTPDQVEAVHDQQVLAELPLESDNFLFEAAAVGHRGGPAHLF